jgi:hypothetical protein
MAKAIYALKVWMFRHQFKLTKYEERGLRRLCLFIVNFYTRAWVESTKPTAAPRRDLQLLKELTVFNDQEIRKAACGKLLNHLWYLSEELVALAFFDPEVSNDEKLRMVDALDKEGSEDNPKRIKLPMSGVPCAELADFVSSRTRDFFNKLGLKSNFLALHPSTWEREKEFVEGLNIATSIRVVNDHAERGVALIQEFNKKITHEEEQMQFLLQVVSEHRKLYPDCLKRTLAK